LALAVAVPVLRAVVSTPRVPPPLVIFHAPRRQPSTTVVVVAGADGAAPVGVGPGPVVVEGEVDGVEDVGVGEFEGAVGDADAGDPVLASDVGSEEGDEVWLPICPHTPPAMSPTTAAITSATTTSAPDEMAPSAPRTLLLTGTTLGLRRGATRQAGGWEDLAMTEQPSIAGTRLSAADYLAAYDADGAALLGASTDLTADVPGCPGWVVRDLLSHVIGVYRHKIAALDLGAAPEQRDEGWGALAPDDDPRQVLREAHAALRSRLDVDAATPAWSWWPGEQTVGFWQRRMAHETAVHRWDADSAAVGVADAGPIDGALAVDGIDELLGWMTWPWDDAQDEARGQQVMVSTDEIAWTITLEPTRLIVVPGASESAVALVAGEPSALLLHLWGRPSASEVATGGDVVALRLLRERIDMATS
jgi:uncharacterized protein (TIGR03083 family)